MKQTAQTIEQPMVNHALLNVVTPIGLSFEKTSFPLVKTGEKPMGSSVIPKR